MSSGERRIIKFTVPLVHYNRETRERETLEREVMLDIDFEALAIWLGQRCLRSKRGKSIVQDGIIKASIR